MNKKAMWDTKLVAQACAETRKVLFEAIFEENGPEMLDTHMERLRWLRSPDGSMPQVHIEETIDAVNDILMRLKVASEMYVRWDGEPIKGFEEEA